MPQDGYESVTVPTDDYDKASNYKPDGATWGEVLVAGAERLNEKLDSDGFYINSSTTTESIDYSVLAQGLAAELEQPDEPDPADMHADQLASEVAKRIDHNEIARVVAERVAEELRA